MKNGKHIRASSTVQTKYYVCCVHCFSNDNIVTHLEIYNRKNNTAINIIKNIEVTNYS